MANTAGQEFNSDQFGQHRRCLRHQEPIGRGHGYYSQAGSHPSRGGLSGSLPGRTTLLNGFTDLDVSNFLIKKLSFDTLQAHLAHMEAISASHLADGP